MGYFPFTVGGNVHQPMTTEIEALEEKSIGKGFKAFSFKTPKGTLRIAESITGAIISDSFKEAKKDVKDGSKKVINKQIEDAQAQLSRGAKHLSNKKFFQLYNY